MTIIFYALTITNYNNVTCIRSHIRQVIVITAMCISEYYILPASERSTPP